MPQGNRKCETCRFGEPLGEFIECYHGPNIADKYPDEWCYQWQEKKRVETQEIEKEE